jgi:hypothetical protein
MGIVLTEVETASKIAFLLLGFLFTVRYGAAAGIPDGTALNPHPELGRCRLNGS